MNPLPMYFSSENHTFDFGCNGERQMYMQSVKVPPRSTQRPTAYPTGLSRAPATADAPPMRGTAPPRQQQQFQPWAQTTPVRKGSHSETAEFLPKSLQLTKLVSANMVMNTDRGHMSSGSSTASARSTVLGGEERSLYASMPGTSLHSSVSSHRPAPIASRENHAAPRGSKICRSCESPADVTASECQICGDPFPPPSNIQYACRPKPPPEVVPLSAINREPMVWLSRGFSIRTPSGPREVRLPIPAQAAFGSGPSLYATAPHHVRAQEDSEMIGRWL